MAEDENNGKTPGPVPSEPVDLFAAIGHDIRTQVGIVSTAAEMLAASGLNDRQAAYATMVVDAAAILSGLLNDLLDKAKLDAGAFTIEQIPFAPGQLAILAVEAIRPKTEQKGIAVRLDIDDGVPEQLAGDPLRIRQCLANLLDNAAKYTEDGEIAVTLAAAPDGDGWRLQFTVTDTGIGLDEAAQQRIFRPYVQARSDVARRYGGTGLGLAITKQLAELMGGSLAVTSRAGDGASFVLTLRCAAVAPAAEPAPHHAAAGTRQPLAGLSVLVADDNRINRTLIASLLDGFGIDHDEVGSGSAAIAALAERRYDAVLLDIRMPDMDGIEALRHIRAMAGGDRLAVIALTAADRAELLKDKDAREFDAVLTKPLDIAALYRTLAAIVDR